MRIYNGNFVDAGGAYGNDHFQDNSSLYNYTGDLITNYYNNYNLGEVFSPFNPHTDPNSYDNYTYYVRTNFQRGRIDPDLESTFPIKYPSETHSVYWRKHTPSGMQDYDARHFSIVLSYIAITPYKINVPTLESIQSYLPQYYITDPNSGKTYCVYDLSLLDRFSDTDPAIDARYQGGLNITYTRTFDGKTYTQTVPVTIDQRSCPAYMKR
jgi:hypothetical protein